MLDKLAYIISIKMKNYYTTRNDNVEIYEYMLKVFLNTFGVILICSAVSYFLGYLEVELFTLISVGILKFFTGGIHIKNNDICVIISSTILLFLPVIFFTLYQFLSSYLFILGAIAIIIVFFLAPQRIEVRGIQKILYKTLSLVILLICIFVIKNELIIFSQSLHCISLLILREKKHD